MRLWISIRSISHYFNLAFLPIRFQIVSGAQNADFVQPQPQSVEMCGPSVVLIGDQFAHQQLSPSSERLSIENCENAVAGTYSRL